VPFKPFLDLEKVKNNNFNQMGFSSNEGEKMYKELSSEELRK